LAITATAATLVEQPNGMKSLIVTLVYSMCRAAKPHDDGNHRCGRFKISTAHLVGLRHAVVVVRGGWIVDGYNAQFAVLLQPTS
jgi:hypothetical protein